MTLLQPLDTDLAIQGDSKAKSSFISTEHNMTRDSCAQVVNNEQSDAHASTHGTANVDSLPTLKDYTSATLSEKETNALSYMYGMFLMLTAPKMSQKEFSE